MAQYTTALDIGSEKITAIIGTRGTNGTINVKGLGVKNYDGFMNGEWLNPDGLAEAIEGALAEAASIASIAIKRIYVSVPGEFCDVTCKEVNSTLNRKRKVTANDLFALMSTGDDFDESVEVINIQPVYYTLDNDVRVVQPEGQMTTKIGGFLSYITAKSEFTTQLRAILNDLGISSIEFVSSPLAESLILFDEQKRDGTALLVDVGYLTTSVAVVKGDGLLMLKTFSLGGGFITADLTEQFSIGFNDAEQLKRKVILTLAPQEGDEYEICTKSGVIRFSASDTNDIVSARITHIATMVKKCLAMSTYNYPSHIPLSVTGGGVAFIKGAKDIFSMVLEREVEIVAPKFPGVNKPNLSSAWGVLDTAIKNDEQTAKKGFFARLLGK